MLFFRRLMFTSTELEPENALGAFLQTRAPVLDKISGPMGARFVSSTGLGFGNLTERMRFFPVPVLDQTRSPILDHPQSPKVFRSESDLPNHMLSELAPGLQLFLTLSCMPGSPFPEGSQRAI